MGRCIGICQSSGIKSDGTQRRGSQCSRNSAINSEFCWQHKRVKNVLNERKPISSELSKQVWAKHGPNCNNCDKLLSFDDSIEKFTHAHIIPVTNGGMNTLENLCVACQSCNSKCNNQNWNEFVNKKSEDVLDDIKKLKNIILELQTKLIEEQKKNMSLKLVQLTIKK